MNRVRRGKDFKVLWSFFDFEGKPYPLDKTFLTLYVSNSFDRFEVTDFVVEENTIIWLFRGKDQKALGDYTLELIKNNGTEGMIPIDSVDAFTLVQYSRDESLCGGGNVKIEDVTVNSTLDIETIASLVIDTEFSETSSNALANNVITKEFKRVNEAIENIDIKADSELSEASENPVQNKVVTAALGKKQDNLVSGENIKTINGESILGKGNLTIKGSNSTYVTDFTVADLNDVINGGPKQCNLARLKQALENKEIILVPYGPEELKGYSLLQGYSEDLLYFAVTDERGNIYSVETDTNAREIYSENVTFISPVTNQADIESLKNDKVSKADVANLVPYDRWESTNMELMGDINRIDEATTKQSAQLTELSTGIVIKKGSAENSAVLKGGNNQVISEGSVALGKDNISGLKGWYYKAVQIGKDGNVVYLYLTTEQQIPVLVSTANAVENQEKDININISKGDICSIINGNRLIDCFEFRLNEISNYGRISFTYKGEGTNPLSTIQNVEELKLEDYSVFCISKPSCGIVNLSKCNIALGNNTKSLAESSVSIGLRSTAVGITTYAEGQDTIAVGECSHAEGAFTKSNGIASHTEGFGTQTEGLSAHAEGYNTLASGGASHSEGSATKATGLHSHAEGDTTLASGSQSHAEGNGTTASGPYSHAEGSGTVAEEDSSHAEGVNTTASGNYSHAEGGSTTASGPYSHAEGSRAKATGTCSHAEGGSTTAEGIYSHAEGYSTKATANSSHAEGNGTTAEGNYSHAEGLDTIATNPAEHASGKCNQSTNSTDSAKATCFSIGIGTSNTDRKNAVEVKANGDVYIIGVGGYDGTNSDSAQTLQEILANL